MNAAVSPSMESGERSVIRPEDVHESFRGEFLMLSPNSRRVVSKELLEDIQELEREGTVADVFDESGLLTQEGYLQLIDAEPDVSLPEEEFLEVVEEVFFTQLKHYGESLGHPYHDIPHDLETAFNFTKVLAEFLKTTELPLSEVQCAIIDALAHDLGHCGRTLRQFDPSTDERIIGEISNEMRAVTLLDPILKKYGFSIRQRLASQGRILATTFFDFDKEKDLMPDEKLTPHSRLERLLSISDLAAGALMEDEERFLDRTEAVLFAEKPKKAWPKDMEDWFKKMDGFFRFFVSKRMKGSNGDVLLETEAIFGAVFKQRSAMFDVLNDENEQVRNIAGQVFKEFLENARQRFQPYFDELQRESGTAA